MRIGASCPSDQRASSRAAARLLLLAAALVAGSTAMPRAAHAYTDTEIAAYVKRRLSCSAVFSEKTLAARVRGASGPIQVFRFLTEYCPGLGFPGASFAAVAPGPGGMTLLLPQPMQFEVEGFTVVDGYLVATNFALGPNDPHCCPSLRTRERWKVSGSGFVRVP